MKIFILIFLAIFGIGIIFYHNISVQETWMLYREDIVYLLGEHIKLVVISGSLAIAMAIPFGIFLTRSKIRPYAEKIIQVLNVGTTIPTLAILALSMSILGIGAIPALFALWLATLLPIVRNTYIGIVGISPALLEAANGVGMTKWQILFRIEIPNALFVIFAGVRTAIALNIGDYCGLCFRAGTVLVNPQRSKSSKVVYSFNLFLFLGEN